MHRAALVAGPGEHLLERIEHPRALVAGDEPHAGEAAFPELGEELARGVHLGHGGHEGSADVLVLLDLVLREEVTDAQLGMRNVSMPTHAAGLCSQRPLRLFAPPPHSWSASASITSFTSYSASRLSSSCISMAPSSKRGMASMSGVGSDKISIAVFVLS